MIGIEFDRTGNCSYGRLLSTYPTSVCLAVAVFAVSCLIAVFTAHSIPDFSDPQLVSSQLIFYLYD